jgi:hypothetical protein
LIDRADKKKRRFTGDAFFHSVRALTQRSTGAEECSFARSTRRGHCELFLTFVNNRNNRLENVEKVRVPKK